MADNLLDTNILALMARGFESQAGLFIGVYDSEGNEIFVGENTSFSEEEVMACISRLGGVGVENIIDSPVTAMAMRGAEGELLGVWLIRPSGSVSAEEMDRVLGLIETVAGAYILERQKAFILEGQLEATERTGEDLSKELRQNEVTTEILGKVESEDDFDKVAYDILALAGEYLSLSNAFIIQLNQQEGVADILTEWRGANAESIISGFSDVEIRDLPFANGLSYTVSSDSRMPDVFRDYLRARDISAGVFLPIHLNDINVMYLCATMERTPRHWKLSEASFLNDVKRVITTILSRRITKNSLASSYAVVEAVLENTGCGICVISQEDGSILYTNERFRVMFDDLSDKQRLERKLKQIPDKMTQIREYYVENANIYISIDLSVINWVDETPVRLATMFDITKTKEFEERIEKQANIDELTGIFNRTYFNKELGKLLSSPHVPGAFICLNIDGFKDVNISVGSKAGDSILASVAKFLLKMAGEYLRVYRLGADEFAITIYDSEKMDPRVVAESIIRRFDQPWQLPYTDCFLTASIGVTEFPKDGDDLYTVYQNGSIALSEARRKSGCIEYFSTAIDEAEKERIRVRSALRSQIKAGCTGLNIFKIPYGFMFSEDDIRPGFITSMRWQAEDLEEMHLYDIVNYAKRQNMDASVIEYFIRESIGALRDQNDFGYPDHYMGILIEAWDFVRIDIKSIIDGAMKIFNALPERIVICLTGGWPSEESGTVLRTCKSLREEGMHIAYVYPEENEEIDLITDVKAIVKNY